MSAPPFGIVPTGCSVITEAASTPSPTSFLYTLPNTKPFSHVVVFLLPGVVLPPDTAAAIYLTTLREATSAESSGRPPSFRFLGGIGPGKESSVFKIGSSDRTGDSMTGTAGAGSDLVIGVSIEPAASVSNRMAEMPAPKSSAPTGTSIPPVVLAQRIIQSAFNFLSGFSGTAGPGQVEVVPLKAFEDWWRKYEGRLRSDPGFLEREG